jgi:hypothetical protein
MKEWRLGTYAELLDKPEGLSERGAIAKCVRAYSKK